METINNFLENLDLSNISETVNATKSKYNFSKIFTDNQKGVKNLVTKIWAEKIPINLYDNESEVKNDKKGAGSILKTVRNILQKKIKTNLTSLTNYEHLQKNEIENNLKTLYLIFNYTEFSNFENFCNNFQPNFSEKFLNKIITKIAPEKPEKLKK